MQSKYLSQFTNKYSVSKTLRFELVPQGETLENFLNSGFLEKDQERAKDYVVVKKLIDLYHKHFIELCLSNLTLPHLEEFATLYYNKNKTEEQKLEFGNYQTKIREHIVNIFNKHETFKGLFGEDMIKTYLSGWNDGITETEQEIVDKFKRFTTYFKGFADNRKHMYSNEAKAGCIAFRIVNENLPKVLDNIRIFENIKNKADFDLENFEDSIDTLRNENTLDEIFSLKYINKILNQKGIDSYNAILAGKSFTTGSEKLQGLNEKINLYRQSLNLSKKELPDLTLLFKQILTDKESISWIPESVESDQELLQKIYQLYHNELLELVTEDGVILNVFEDLGKLLDNLKEYTLLNVFIRNDTQLTDISKQIFKDHNFINTCLDMYYEQIENPLLRIASISYLTKKNKWLKEKYKSIHTIEAAILNYFENNKDIIHEFSITPILDYFNSNYKFAENIISNINLNYENIKELLTTTYPKSKNLKQNQNEVELIKLFLDALMQLLHFVKPIAANGEGDNLDSIFYNQFDVFYNQLKIIPKIYDLTRSYLTKKPFSVDKIKLNFDRATLADGWDINKEEANLTTIIIDEKQKYYLLIMNPNHNQVFRNIPVDLDDSIYKKMRYKQISGASKSFPKVVFAANPIVNFNISEEILAIRESGAYKYGPTFDLAKCHKFIDFYKACMELHPEWKLYEFKFSPTKSYNNINDFFIEADDQAYKITYTDVPKGYIDQLVNEGKVYLFQIYNQDFAPGKKEGSKDNLHTTYWKEVFSPENLTDVVYKLNGKAEVFFREKSIINNIVTHHKKTELANKYILKGDKMEMVPTDTVKRLNAFYNSNIKESELTKVDLQYLNNSTIRDYDIVKDKRFTMDKFQFHVPITMNYKAKGRGNINTEVQTFLKNNEDINIIGIDRGERHLLYVSVINQKGEILEQKSLNEIINHKNQKIDYHKLLDSKENQRDTARKSWSLIENIKELKEGYISQITHYLAKLMVDHNAIIVMEDLNQGFKRGRQKIEKQIYQKFEKMLIDKLNYLIFKEKELKTAPGGSLRALQLANQVSSLKDIRGQQGFLFYVQAWNTSKIDPATGFMNMLYFKFESELKAKEFLGRFDSISYNVEANYFEFTFDYKNFPKALIYGKTKWTVCTHGNNIRTIWNKNKPNTNNKGGFDQINVTQEIKTLLASKQIELSNGNLKNSIVNVNDAKFFESLTRMLNITLAMRYTIDKITDSQEVDFLISPVKGPNGTFFDSSKINENPATNIKQPNNPDANGAYHIAMKGLCILNKINTLEGSHTNVSNPEWIDFIQNKNYGNVHNDILPQ